MVPASLHATALMRASRRSSHAAAASNRLCPAHPAMNTLESVKTIWDARSQP